DRPDADALQTQLRLAVERGDARVIKDMAKAHPWLIRSTKGPSHRSFLLGHAAVAEVVTRRFTGVCDLLMELGVGVDAGSATLLGRLDLLSKAVERSPHLLQGTSAGMLLYWASGEPTGRSLTWLLERGLSPNALNSQGRPALISACTAGNLRAVHLLL